MELQHLFFDSAEELGRQDYFQRIYSLRATGTQKISVTSEGNLIESLGCLCINMLPFCLRVSARENRPADHISVGCCSYQTSNHGNIYFLIDIIVFENRPPPPQYRPRGVLKGVILGGLHKSISLHLVKPLIQVYIHRTRVLCPFK